VVRGDVLDIDSLHEALVGVDTAYYLVHSMGAGSEFEERDRVGARNFAAAARAAGVRRIVYLGGLGAVVPHAHCFWKRLGILAISDHRPTYR